MAKSYKVVAHSANEIHYTKAIGKYKTREDALSKIHLWEDQGPYDFIGMYEIIEEDL